MSEIRRRIFRQLFTGIFLDQRGLIGAGASGLTVVGTPVDNQIAVWTTATSIEGDANFTWNGTLLTIAGTGSGLRLTAADAQIIFGGATDPGWTIAAIQFTSATSIFGRGTNTLAVNANAYYDGSDKYMIADTAAQMLYTSAITFQTAVSGSAGAAITWVVGLEVLQGGAVRFANIGTTASAANAFLDSGASNNLLRSTSSLRYKTVIGDLSLAEARAIILGLRPITYYSKAPADVPTRVFVGFTAEDVAVLDARFITYDQLGRPDWVQYSTLIAPLVAIVKDHNTSLDRHTALLKKICAALPGVCV